MVRRLVMAALMSGTVAVLAAPASAQVSPNNQPPPQVESLVVTRQANPPATPSAAPEVLGAQIEAAPAGPQVAGLTAQAPVSTLPLTGGDIAALAASGAGLLGTGALLVRRTRRR